MYKLSQFIQSELDRALEPSSIDTRRYSVLGVLAHMGPLSQQAVGAKLRIDRATMVGLLDDLERLGFLERRRNADDRRLYDLTITDAGRATVLKSENAVRNVETRMFAPLTATARKQLHSILSSLTAPNE